MPDAKLIYSSTSNYGLVALARGRSRTAVPPAAAILKGERELLVHFPAFNAFLRLLGFQYKAALLV